MKFYYCLLLICINCSCYSQQNNSLLSQIETQLSDGQTTVSNVLSDEKYMTLHPDAAFRDIIKKYAKPGKIKITTDSEPDKKITVKGTITTAAGKPLNDALVYVYQTSDKGWYAADVPHVGGNEGDMKHARLFGYLKTGSQGEFGYITIQPRGYPNSDLPAHIHIAVWKDGQLIHGIPGELLFDDDERLTPERRKQAIANGFLIEKGTGNLSDPAYSYKIVVKD
jgi:protocatechuate 3,4-dioxygenase beta subunit